MRQNEALCGNGLALYQVTKFRIGPNLKHLQMKKNYVTKLLKILVQSVENIMGKGENADYQYFSFSHDVFKSFFFPRSLTVPTQSQLLMFLRKKAYENIVGKGENAGNHHIYLVLWQLFQFEPF